jgi:predicted nucleic-acid-binding protein
VKKTASSLPDTNVIIRYLTGDDPQLFTSAKEFFDKVKSSESKAIILESIIAECIYVLTNIYRVPRNRAAGSLIDILRYKGIINKDRKELIEALTLFTEHNLDIVDCILYCKANSGKNHVFSFDSDLKRLTGKIS